MVAIDPRVRRELQRGLVIPACPLAVDAERNLDERRQRALVRYYLAAGAGGLAVGVHTTQFAIRDAGLLRPVLDIAAQELSRGSNSPTPPVRVAGLCGGTGQACSEARQAAELGYHAGLLSLGALQTASDDDLARHCQRVAEILPLIGFYLQPAAGGRLLPYAFWRRFCEIENVVAIKIAPFNRYQTLDVIRAVIDAGREDIALYTGNDDNIVADLVTPFRFKVGSEVRERRIVGGLLGQWAVSTRRAVEIHARCREAAESGAAIPPELLALGVELTDANAAVFDAANGYLGCIAGIHEVLRRQGLLAGAWCLDPSETLGPGQAVELDRVCQAYPHLADDEFVARHLGEWLD